MNDNRKSKNITENQEFNLKKHWLWLPTLVLLGVNLTFFVASFIPFDPNSTGIVIYPLLILGARLFGIVSYCLLGFCFLFAASKKPFGMEQSQRSRALILLILFLNLPLTCYTFTIQSREIQYQPEFRFETPEATYHLTLYKPDECQGISCTLYLIHQCDTSGTFCHLKYVSDRYDSLEYGTKQLVLRDAEIAFFSGTEVVTTLPLE